MRKKLLISILLFVIVSVVGTTTTCAFFLISSSASINVELASMNVLIMQSGGTDPIVDATEGTENEKEIKIKNLSTIPVFVRVSIAEEWEKNQESLPSNNVSYGYGDVINDPSTVNNTIEWYKASDNYYYRRLELAPMQESGNIITNFIIDNATSNYSDSTLNLNITAETCQTKNELWQTIFNTIENPLPVPVSNSWNEQQGGPDTTIPTSEFGTNGNSTYAKNRSTTVTVSDNVALDINSLKYQWTTSTDAPLEGSFSTTFTNGQTINTPNGVTGGYYLWILAKDTSNNTTITKSNVFNLDNTIPVISLLGENSVTVNQGSVYTDAGATASDNIDGDITVNIDIDSTVNTSVIGEYTVTYNVTDSSGNSAIEVVRDVIVEVSYEDYIESEGVNKPRLASGMTAIKWNGSSWDTVSNPDTDTSWYNYTNKEWANARTADGSMWVWIPRYAYQIATNYHTATTGTINIKFLKDDTNTASDNSTVATTPTYSGSSQTNYIMHPAFNFGGTQVTGMWIAKFEPSVSDQSSSCYVSGGATCNATTFTPKIIPNAKSWRDQDVGVAFTVCRNMENAGNPYGWNANEVDTHLMKNTEWGLISYLSSSSFGKTGRMWINPNSNYITGCAGDSQGAASTTACNEYHTSNGVNASTTGNIYGIYDIAGCSWERPSAYINNGSADLTTYGASVVSANPKYKDIYPVGTGDTTDANYSASNVIFGDAIWETSSTALNYTAWNSEYSRMPYAVEPWFYRSGDNTYTTSAGPFAFRYVSGARSSNRTFRPVVIVAVIDDIAPVITILGSNPVSIAQGSVYNDAGATASDDIDGNITGSINVVSNVNPSVPGAYSVTYNVSDAAGNAAVTVVRTVNVVGASGPDFVVSEGVNKPRLTTGMTAIKWNGSSWDTVSNPDTDTSWYDYTNKEWANAKTADGSFWVWIPRYAYQITSGYHTATAGSINIKFLKDNTNTAVDNSIVATTPTYSGSSQTNYIMHPAFNFGGTQITGIWIAKFEPSVSNQSDPCYTSPSGTNCDITTLVPKIIPNANSWRNQQASTAFTVSRNMENAGNPYGWNAGAVDTHLQKNTEWGAVAYLSASLYGKTGRIWINPNSNYITGCAGSSQGAASTTSCNQYNTVNGVNASTTGNIYGIYDMAGGAWERTAAYINNSNSDITTYGLSLANADAKYKDMYTMGSGDTTQSNYDVSNSIFGDAVYETSSTPLNYTAWNSEYSRMPYAAEPWFYRGCDNTYTTAAGPFGFRYVSGAFSSNRTFRPVVIVTQTTDNISPVITMNGSSPVTINVGDIYNDAGATASDNADGNITSSIQTTSTVNVSIPGSYTVTYNVSDLSGNAAIPVVRTVNVVDNVAPSVAFGTNGNTTYAKSRSTTATISDSHSSVNTSSLKYQWTTSTTAPAEGTFSTTFTNEQTINTPGGVTGEYYLWILAKDNAAIPNTTIIRSNVFNLDNTIPVITLLGENPITINQGSVYTDAGSTASDNIDGDITGSINTNSTVNPSIVGQYKVTYTVSDSSGNVATQVVRDVIVEVSYEDYIASEGVNKPKLTTGMTAIKWNGSSWDNVVSPDTDTSWYDYANKQWANAKTADGSFWVWIPRYAYQIASGYHTSTAGTINVKFLKDDTNTASDNNTVDTSPTYSGSSQTNFIVHPAFNFGGTNLTGIWIAKFEPSVADQSNSCYTSDTNCHLTTLIPKIIPNAYSWRNLNINTSYTVTRNMETNNVYGWGTSGNGIDTHIAKNTEWGVAVYLAQSTYGKNDEIWINPSDGYITGCAGDSLSSAITTGCLRSYETTNGQQSSTTGNIYGIYDMSGGSQENTMGNYNNDISNSGLNPTGVPDKYINRYSGTNYGLNTNVIGDAVYETSIGYVWNGTTWVGTSNSAWYGDSSSMPNTSSWFGRGYTYGYGQGATAIGIYAYRQTGGGPYDYTSFRPVLLVGGGL